MDLHFPSIELIEKRTEELGNMVIVPNSIRVDGIEWATSADQPITVESIDLAGGGSPALVTFTVLARRVVIDTEVS